VQCAYSLFQSNWHMYNYHIMSSYWNKGLGKNYNFGDLALHSLNAYETSHVSLLIHRKVKEPKKNRSKLLCQFGYQVSLKWDKPELRLSV
jgi:hypothetical protein